MTTLPPVIGLYSPAPQSGKTTVANYLTRHGFIRISFAEPIKEMTIVLLRQMGMTKSEAKHAVYNDKTIRVPEIGLTVRQVLQTLGTEYGRDYLHPEIWVMSWRRRVTEALDAGHHVVTDDVRAFNEAYAIRNLDGQLWYIDRPGVTRETTHTSEGALDGFEAFDFRLHNHSSITSLHLAICQRLGVPHLPEPADLPTAA